MQGIDEEHAGVFSAGNDGEAVFYPALDQDQADIAAVQAKMRTRGLRWLHRHGRPTIERILDHLGEPTQPPVVAPARSPAQGAFRFDQTAATVDWPEMDQTAGQADGRA